jgi:hypothetical protein
MAAYRGPLPAFDLSDPSSNKGTFRYGDPVTADYPDDSLVSWATPGFQKQTYGFTNGLRRYIVSYNQSTKSYEHVQTQKAFRRLITDPSGTTETQLSNSLHTTYGSVVAESMPTGLLDQLPSLFDRPVPKQQMFIDCCTKVLTINNGESPTNIPITINKPYVTRVSRYGVLKNGQVVYFKNILDLPRGFWKTIDS